MCIVCIDIYTNERLLCIIVIYAADYKNQAYVPRNWLFYVWCVLMIPGASWQSGKGACDIDMGILILNTERDIEYN